MLKKEIKKKTFLQKCPNCNEKAFLTRLKDKHFYCTSCLIELKVVSNKLLLMEVDEEGKEIILSQVYNFALV
jgi:hypothetical protein